MRVSPKVWVVLIALAVLVVAAEVVFALPVHGHQFAPVPMG